MNIVDFVDLDVVIVDLGLWIEVIDILFGDDDIVVSIIF